MEKATNIGAKEGESHMSSLASIVQLRQVQLAAVRRLAHEAADSGLLSPAKTIGINPIGIMFLLVDGVCSQTTGFEVHAVANDHDAIEGQPWLGAVPGDELIDGVLVNAARAWRAEAVEHCQFAMIQIRQPKHSATVIRLNSPIRLLGNHVTRRTLL